MYVCIECMDALCEEEAYSVGGAWRVASLDASRLIVAHSGISPAHPHRPLASKSHRMFWASGISFADEMITLHPLVAFIRVTHRHICCTTLLLILQCLKCV